MLVLSRHIDQSIVIGDSIVITIVDIRGDKVRLGIEAPKNVPVHRLEVWEAIQQQSQEHQAQQHGEQRNGHVPEPTAEAESEAGDHPPAAALREGQG